MAAGAIFATASTAAITAGRQRPDSVVHNL
jgi:hypothetical protein